MTTPRYLPVTDLKAQTRDETTADDDLKEQAINAAETWIDNELQRRMVVITSGAEGLTTRVYTPAASDVLYIYDCTEVTAVVEDGTTLTVSTDYQLEPLNGLSGSGESVPYYKIKRHDRYWYRDGHKVTVSVTARYGWAAIPPEVVEACKIIAQDILANRDTRFGLAAISDVGFGTRMRENPAVAKMIEHYRYAYKTFGIA